MSPRASANHAQTALLSLLALVALLNVPQAMLDTNALAASVTASALTTRLLEAEAVLLLAPAAFVGTALLVLAWRSRRDLVRSVAAGRATLASCLRAAVHAAARCPGAAAGTADEGPPLDAPLLPGTSSKLNSNSRGL